MSANTSANTRAAATDTRPTFTRVWAAIATFLTIGGAAERDLATADDTWDAAAHGGDADAVGDGERHTADQDVNRQRKVVLFAVSTFGLSVAALGLLLV